MTADDLMRLVNRYTEACDDLGSGLFEQTEAETAAKHGKAKGLHIQILAEVYRLHAEISKSERRALMLGDDLDSERERCIAACTEVMNACGGDPSGRLLSSERVRMQHQLQASGAAQCIERILGPNGPHERAFGPTPLEQIREVFAAARETGVVNGCDCAPLTDEQLWDIAREVAPGQLPQSVFAHWPGLKAFARAVELAHGIGG